MRADTITVRRLDAAEAALFLGAFLAGAGALSHEAVSCVVGVALAFGGCVVAWAEQRRVDGDVTHEPTPASPATRYTAAGTGDAGQIAAQRTRRVR